MTDDLPANGNGYTTKEIVVRLEATLCDHIDKQDEVNAKMAEAISALTILMQTHIGDKHPERVVALWDEHNRREGGTDMVKVLFGTSVLGMILSVLGVVAFFTGK